MRWHPKMGETIWIETKIKSIFATITLKFYVMVINMSEGFRTQVA